MDHRSVPPAPVRGNDWPSLAAAPADSFKPTLPASVVISYYEAPGALDLTLAALEGQTYPRELFEVVVVDDGSRTPLAPPAGSPLNVRVLHQEDRGFGLARARNTGARAAAHEIIVFLDCDMMPEAGWLAEHARWHHAANDALTLGFRAHVEVDGIDAAAVRSRPGSLADLFAGRVVERPAWIEYHMSRTRDLTSDDDDLFRAVTGGNLGVSRSFFDLVGGFDETFTQWGAEDTEFGYRAYTRGSLLVPTRDALCWHQGAGAAPSQSESVSLELQQAKISQLIAHHGFRRSGPGRSFTVPQYVVTVLAGEAEAQLGTVDQVLAGSVHDLVVWVTEPAEPADRDEPARERIRRLMAGDPRVRFGPADGASLAIPAASFHISIPAGATVKASTVRRLRRELGSAASASSKLPDRLTAEIVRTRALNRAARSGIDPAAHPSSTRFTTRSQRRGLPKRLFELGTRRKSRSERLPRMRRLGRTVARAAGEASGVRSLADVRAFSDRAARAVAWRTRRAARKLLWSIRRTGRRLRRAAKRLRWAARRRRRAVIRLVRRLTWMGRRLLGRGRRLLWKRARLLRRGSNLGIAPGRGDGEPPPARYRLGPEIVARGPRAEAVFAASSRVGSAVGDDTQAVVVDTPDIANDIGAGTATVVVLSEADPRASVPAFDAESLNPVDWTAQHRPHAVALGPAQDLPDRARTRRTVAPDGRTACRRAHHVEDVAAFHRDAVHRAGTLAALAASGAVVHLADNDRELHHRVGSELYSLMADQRVTSADAHEREAFSVAMRRSALRDHSLRARTRQILAPTGLCAPPLPLVSILLATRRPDRLTAAVGAVAAQTYPRIELVLAPHGSGFDRAEIDGLLGGVGCEARVVPAAASLPLGTVLNEAAAQASGTLLTKFDDDDHYGPEHLWDLVLAHEYSRAPLVGKGAEFVYLAGSDRTLRRFAGGAERYITRQSVAGGAMMITRHCFDAVLGWRPIPRGVDKALIEDVVAGGHRAYRTHGFGYMLVRHGEGHTWEADDAYFVDQANEVRPGRDPAFAGIAPPGTA